MFLLFAVTMTNIFRRLDLPQIPRDHATRFVFYLFGSAGIAAARLQLYNVAFFGAFWPFFTGIVFQIITTMFQFGRIILIPPE